MDADYDNFMASIEPGAADPKPRAPSPDPLDEFMSQLTSAHQTEKNQTERTDRTENKTGPKKEPPRVRMDLAAEDEDAALTGRISRPVTERTADDPYAGPNAAEDRGKNMAVAELPALDHAQIAYTALTKNVYTEHSAVALRSVSENAALLQNLDIRLKSAAAVPKICTEFAQMNLAPASARLLVATLGVPTAVQMAVVPCALAGLDVMAVAPTGSGKTLAYALPMAEKLARSARPSGGGPRAVVVAPTLELCQQICAEAAPYLKAARARALVLHGGGTYHAQARELRKGIDVVYATPGRIVNLIQRDKLAFPHVGLLVLDEADRMLQLGFKSQIRSLVGQLRPDRQTMLLSATFPNEIRYLSSAVTKDCVQIFVGRPGTPNANITQKIEVLLSEEAKSGWLHASLPGFVGAGAVLVFVSTRARCESVASSVRECNREINCAYLHGELPPKTRADVISKFKAGEINVLVATDIAARGIHFEGLDVVVSVDPAKNPQAHVNRIGRTGRRGRAGTAYTLLSPADVKAARFIRANLVQSRQPVPRPLALLCEQSDAAEGPVEGGLGPKRKLGEMQNTASATAKNMIRKNGEMGSFGGGGMGALKSSFQKGFVSAKRK